MLQGLRAICFDLDDTLWDVRPVLQRAEDRVLGFLRERYPALAENHSTPGFAAARMALARAEPGRAHDFTWLRTETMRRLAVEAGFSATVGDEAFEVFIAARSEVQPFDDVVPALELLRSRYVLASFSNGNADLARIPIGTHFALSLNAERVGVAKPHPESFGAVARALGMPPAEILYVGDDPRLDVRGARAAGFRTAWVNREPRAWPPEEGEPGDLEIRHLGELASALVPR